MPFRVRGLEGQSLWVVYAANRETADRVAELFLTQGFGEVSVETMPGS